MTSSPTQPLSRAHIPTTLDHVWLEPMTANDAAQLVAIYRRNAEHLTRFGDYREHVRASVDEVREELSGLDARLCYKIVVSRRFAGRVELVAVNPPKYGLGYLLDESECGRGVATEAVRALVNYAFESLNATDVFAGVTHGNEPSVALLRRLGFKRIEQFERYDRYHLDGSTRTTPGKSLGQ